SFCTSSGTCFSFTVCSAACSVCSTSGLPHCPQNFPDCCSKLHCLQTSISHISLLIVLLLFLISLGFFIFNFCNFLAVVCFFDMIDFFAIVIGHFFCAFFIVRIRKFFSRDR